MDVLPPNSSLVYAKTVPITIKHISQQQQNSNTPANNISGNGLPTSATTGGLVGLRSSTIPSDRFHHEEKGHGITVQIAMGTKNAGRLKCLEIRLTDDSDPFFLFSLDIGEDDFHALRSEQNLLVDFVQFPAKFIELLDLCIASGDDEFPKFLGQLTTEPSTSRLYSTFNIIETNTFKHITHLSLHFIPGNDIAIRQYLATLVKDYKTQTSTLKSQLSSTTNTLSAKLQEAESLNTRLTAELDSIKLIQAEQNTRLQLQHTEAISSERSRVAKEREEERRNLEREKRETEVRYEEQVGFAALVVNVSLLFEQLASQVKVLTQKVATLTTSNEHYKSHSQSLESSLTNANKQIAALQQDVIVARQDAERNGANGRQLDRARTELEAELRAAKERVRELERQERDTSDVARRAEDAVKSMAEQKAKLEDTLNLYKSSTARLEDSLSKATDEINKGNDIIRRLQSDLKAAKSKAKLRNVVTMQQEKLLDERHSTIEALQKEIADIRREIGRKEAEGSDKGKEVEELRAKVEELRQKVEDDNHVIEWLHKQLNEEALHRPMTGFASLNIGSEYKRPTSPTYRSRFPTTNGDSAMPSYNPLSSSTTLKYTPAGAAVGSLAGVGERYGASAGAALGGNGDPVLRRTSPVGRSGSVTGVGRSGSVAGVRGYGVGTGTGPAGKSGGLGAGSGVKSNYFPNA
ncbi:Spindle assembly abnormal protein 6 [Rhizophlyctis rosea]|uniref:Spindle assembly abnormal protein 6 n=1 Tax=Rhizophlyctis rosea TaxID=64517 RepID=A0AAD5SR25_9FUNG|nr:Spindle assembly abnormal protein 6 [Rhizophlyctis rosea]